MLSVMHSPPFSLATENIWFDQSTEAASLKPSTKTSDNPSYVIQNSIPAAVESIVTPAELVGSDLQGQLFVDFVTRLQLRVLREFASSHSEFSLL